MSLANFLFINIPSIFKLPLYQCPRTMVMMPLTKCSSPKFKIGTNSRSVLKTEQDLLVHRFCTCCFGFGSFATKYGVASNFGSEREVQLEQKEVVVLSLKESEKDKQGLTSSVIPSPDGSDSDNIGGGGNHGNSDRGGGGGGDHGGWGGGGGGLDESAEWEGLKWWCWWLFEKWSRHWQFNEPISRAIFSRTVMPLIVELIGGGVEPELEAILIQLLMAILGSMLIVPAVISGYLVAIELLALQFATAVLAFALALFLLFWGFQQHHNL